MRLRKNVKRSGPLCRIFVVCREQPITYFFIGFFRLRANIVETAHDTSSVRNPGSANAEKLADRTCGNPSWIVLKGIVMMLSDVFEINSKYLPPNRILTYIRQISLGPVHSQKSALGQSALYLDGTPSSQAEFLNHYPWRKGTSS